MLRIKTWDEALALKLDSRTDWRRHRRVIAGAAATGMIRWQRGDPD
jgi:hypothetical protein